MTGGTGVGAGGGGAAPDGGTGGDGGPHAARLCQWVEVAGLGPGAFVSPGRRVGPLEGSCNSWGCLVRQVRSL